VNKTVHKWTQVSGNGHFFLTQKCDIPDYQLIKKFGTIIAIPCSNHIFNQKWTINNRNSKFKIQNSKIS